MSVQCTVCDEPITESSKYYPLEYRKFCSSKCVKKGWLIKNRPQRIEQARRSHLKKKFNMTPAEFDALLKKQNNACAICGAVNKEFTDSWGRRRPSLYIDHNHTTKEVRGLLCQGCNTGIGYFRDNPELLRLAATYLESFDDKAIRHIDWPTTLQAIGFEED